MNKEFYDYRNSALRRMKRISDDRSAITDPGELERLNYARSEFSIASAIYYYYLQQEQQSLEAINEIKVDEALESDTRSEEHTSELQSQSYISYAVVCLKKKKVGKNMEE